MPLCRAARRANRARPQSGEAARFMSDLESEVFRLEHELCSGTYKPRGYRRFSISDPKPRMICAAAFRDRVVQHALCAEIMVTLETAAVDHSFACRPKKGSHAAVTYVQRLARRFKYVLKLDVQRLFATVDHVVLKRLLFRRIRDSDLQALIELFVDAGAPAHPTGKGLPIGNLTSQFLSRTT